MKNKRLLAFLLCSILAVYAQGSYTPEYDSNGRLTLSAGDRNRDGYNNLADIDMFASAWLEQDCGLSNDCNNCDVYPAGGDGSIDGRDFAVLANLYGNCTDPTNPDCIHVPLTLFEPPSEPAGCYSFWLESMPLPPQDDYQPNEDFGPASPSGSYGTYGNQGAKPLLPSLPGGGGVSVPWGVEPAELNETIDSVVIPGYTESYGTYGAHGAKPLLPSLPGGGEDHIGWGHAVLDGEMSEESEGVYSGGSYGTYGNQGAKPLLPSLPGGGGFDDFIRYSFCLSHVNVKGLTLQVIEASPSDSYWNPWSEPLYIGYNTIWPVEVFDGLIPNGSNGGAGLLKSFVYVDADGKTHHVDLSYEPSENELECMPYPVGTGPAGGFGQVHLFSGEVCESAVDMHISGRGPDFVWGRKYRSRLDPNTVMGNGWDFSYNIYLEQYGGNLVLHNGWGRRDIYYNQGDGTWAAEGFFRELAQEDDESFTMTFPHKGTWKFLAFSDTNAPGKISAITDLNGNFTTFDYDKYGRTIGTRSSVWDTGEHDRDITIAYNTDGHIESVTDWTGRQVKYEYYAIGDPNGSAGDLKSVTTPAVRGTPTGNDFPEGKTTTYTYSRGFADERLNHNLLTITDAKGQTCLKNIYGTDPTELSFDHVTRQILGGADDIIDITYNLHPPEPVHNFAVLRTVVNDRGGKVTEHFYDNRNRLVVFRQHTGQADPNLPTNIDPNVNAPTGKLRADDPSYFETKFEYNKDSLLTGAAYPNGNEGQFDYDQTNTNPRARGNLLQYCILPGPLGGDQSEICESFEYDTLNNKVTKRTDPRGYETLCDYDANGNRIRTEHLRPAEFSIIRQWQYNEYGQLAASILPDNGSGQGRRDEYVYYAVEDGYQNGYLKNVVVDANNLALTAAFEYDEVGNVIRTIDARGNDTQFIVNELNQVVRGSSREVTDSGGVRYQCDYYYDENNNVVQIDVQNKDEEGILQPNANVTSTYEYDSLNRLIRTTSEVDSVKSVGTEYEYDDNGNLSLVRFGEGVNGNQPNNVIRYLYDERNLLFQTVRAEDDPNQSTTQYDYDGNGNLKKISQGLGSPPHISSFEYDGFNRLVEVNDPMGNVAEYHYDPAGHLVSMHVMGELVDGPGNNNTTYITGYSTYNSSGQIDDVTILHYDPNTLSPIGDGNVVTHFYYNDNSQLTRVVNDNGHETCYEYDTANRLSLVTDTKGNTVTYSYDENSNITALTEVEESDLGEPNETFVTTFQYDNLDRLIHVIDNNDNTAGYGYDSRSNLTRVTDALNNETGYQYDGLSRLIQTVRDMDGNGADATEPNDITTSRVYDDNSRLVAQTDDNGNTTAYQYDALNRLVRTLFADGTDKSFDYDVHHNVIQATDAAGSVVNCTYDLLNRITAKAITPATGVSSDTTFENYKYDGMSRVVYAEDDDSLVTFSYDSLSNVTAETLNGQTVTSVYDGLGNKLSCTYPGGRVITTTYDELNRKKTVMDSTTTIGVYEYIGPARVQRRSYGNDTQCDWAYDSVKRIIGTTQSHLGSSTVIDERTYGWDEAYNRTQRKDVRAGGPQLTHDYTYDAVNRLINTFVTDNSVTPATVVRDTDYALDGVGNRTGVTGDNCPGTYTMDSALPEPADFQMNQYTSIPCESSRSYDLNGNLISIIHDARNSVAMTYDYRNQMVEINDTSTGQVHTYAYDALGRRIEKVVDSDGAAQTTCYLYDGLRVIEEQDDLGTTQATYVYGNRRDEVLNMQRDANDYYYHFGDLYNVMAVTDTDGTVVERYEYEDYGQPSFFDSSGGPITGSAVGNSHLLAGYCYDPESGWYNYYDRYLDPIAGRFTIRGIGPWDRPDSDDIVIVQLFQPQMEGKENYALTAEIVIVIEYFEEG